MVLKAIPKAKGGQSYQTSTGTKMQPIENNIPTLSDQGITKKASTLSQKLANMPEEVKATGTKNQLIGRGVIGGTQVEPPINDTSTLAEQGITLKAHGEQVSKGKPHFEASVKTSKTLAKEHGVSKATVERAGEIAKIIDSVETTSSEIPKWNRRTRHYRVCRSASVAKVKATLAILVFIQIRTDRLLALITIFP